MSHKKVFKVEGKPTIHSGVLIFLCAACLDLLFPPAFMS